MGKLPWAVLLAGICAGAVTGLFGAGGGMILVPMLAAFSGLEEKEIFPASISIILPVCLVSIGYAALTDGFQVGASLPYLIGSAAGGVLAGILGRRIPVLWLHRVLGLLILMGGIRYVVG